MQIGVHEAKTNLSELLRRVAGGEDVIITRSGRPVARIVGISGGPVRQLGSDRGRMTVPDDFDAPLDDATLAGFDS